MARVCISDIEAEMYSLLDQLAELNGCSLEDEFCEVLCWAANDADDEESQPIPLQEEQGARLLVNRKARELKTG